jgi:hypothetical protein
MKRFILMAVVLIAIAVTVTAQTQVSKKIQVLPWLDQAVIDANQAKGGLHHYATWAVLATDLKKAQVEIGMHVYIAGPVADAGDYRLKAWATPAALPLITEWERVGDAIVVADIAARDALDDGTLTTASTLRAISTGTKVLVKANAKGVPEMFIYVNGLVDVDGAAGLTPADKWLSLSGASGSGYVFYGLGAVNATDAVNETNGWNGTTVGAIVVGTTARYSGIPAAGITISLAAGTTVPVIAVPATWPAPVIYLKTGSVMSLLSDCWLKSHATHDGMDYQIWAGDNAFLTGLTGTYTLEIR